MLKIGQNWGKIANYPHQCSTKMGTPRPCAEVPKVAEKDALRYLKTFFVSFALKYIDKENYWQSSCAMTFFFEITQNFE